MKNIDKLKFYVTDWAPNGTADILITDFDGQLLTSLDEAVFGLPCRPKDRLGNVSVLGYGESIMMIAYDDEKSFIENILDGEISDFCPVSEVSFDEVSEHLAISPVRSAEEAEARLTKAIEKALKKAA